MSNRASSRLILGPYQESVVMENARAALEEVGGKVTCAFLFATAD